MTETPIFDFMESSRKIIHNAGKAEGSAEMKKKMLTVLKDRKRIDAELLKKLESL